MDSRDIELQADNVAQQATDNRDRAGELHTQADELERTASELDVQETNLRKTAVDTREAQRAAEAANDAVSQTTGGSRPLI